MTKITVIIPVYNAEKYIERSLDSILIQECINDIEILCINDGSTDNSALIIEKKCLENSSIKLINQKNQGPAHARNFAMSIAKGDYIAFVAVDDFIVCNNLIWLLQEINNSRIDIIFFDSSTIQSKGKISRKISLTVQFFANSDHGFRYLQENHYGPNFCLAFFFSVFLHNNKLLFPLNSNCGKSHFFRMVILTSSRIVLLSDVFYHYVQSEGSYCRVTNTRNLLDLPVLYLKILSALTLSQKAQIGPFKVNNIRGVSLPHCNFSLSDTIMILLSKFVDKIKTDLLKVIDIHVFKVINI
ncbi:glycosyltransferase family 2 protein [Shewanella aestuarii]|uniref:Glycosyltransferase family 2 protein n=1 Tax=Shewanella aestuarii TaxID=1028752 RepID=A0A6G9QHH3_9GAMM|nr:glycosyltransferase family A protein [Shewanella aestuarii]QIR13946.1 glycosyltransferase family 2 protein [Shewanella aestuarii]